MGDLLPLILISCVYYNGSIPVDNTPVISLSTSQSSASQALLLAGKYETKSTSGILGLSNWTPLGAPGVYTILFVVSSDGSWNSVTFVLNLDIQTPYQDLRNSSKDVNLPFIVQTTHSI
jgi:hypothetical protein